MRDQPKDIQDAMVFDDGPRIPEAMTPSMARLLGRDCYEASTNWLNAGRRAKWTDSLRAFQGMHPNGSKYLSNDYRYRSRLFRPKTRAMVRKAEAETAAAFFSNEDVVAISPQDENDPMQLASAEINKQLLQYRLTKTIPWFLTLVGARQDAEVMGICIGKAYWKYSENFSHTEKRAKLNPDTGLPMIDDGGLPAYDDIDVYNKGDDHPWVDLVAAENFRFDPGADWRNPIATSPYLIELIPMYVCDVKAKIDSEEWLSISDSALYASSDLDDDTTRRAREQGRVPGKDNDAWKPRDYDICWVRENIIRQGGQDWHFYSLSSSGELLTLPRPLKQVYLQGLRPYVCGFIVPEAHKTYPTSKAELVRDLQTKANDVDNLRLDNVKLTLNPRQFVKNGEGVDIQDIRTFNPGKVVLLRNPREDIVWDRPPDVTQSAYAEQDKIDSDFDELTGNISPATMQANQQIMDTNGNMEMMQGSAGNLPQYEQRVFAETFVEPLIRQLVKLEQAYETDATILAIAGREAQLYQKFGMNEITDQLLQQELTTKVNVGIGATNPQIKLKNFATAGDLMSKIFGPALAGGLKFEEVTKEIFSLCGYKDGMRFFNSGFDPAKVPPPGQGQQQPMQISDPSKVEAAQVQAQAKLQDRQMQGQTQTQIAQMQEDGDTHRAMLKLHNDRVTQSQNAQHQMTMKTHPLVQSMMGQHNAPN